MKIKECLIKIFSIKNIFIFLISYSIFIITYLDGIYELNSFYYSKFDVYVSVLSLWENPLETNLKIWKVKHST